MNSNNNGNNNSSNEAIEIAAARRRIPAACCCDLARYSCGCDRFAEALTQVERGAIMALLMMDPVFRYNREKKVVSDNRLLVDYLRER